MPRFEHFLQHVGYPEHIARFPPPLKYLRLEPNSLGSAAGIEGLMQRGGGSRPSNRNLKPIEVRGWCREEEVAALPTAILSLLR